MTLMQLLLLWCVASFLVAPIVGRRLARQSAEQPPQILRPAPPARPLAPFRGAAPISGLSIAPLHRRAAGPRD